LASRIQMKESARRKLHGAEHLMERANPLPSEGAYLASIASECSLKALLMTRHSIQDTSEISEDHHLSECFRGKGAHNLSRIFRHLRGFSAPGLPGSQIWKRMTDKGRPYSLRYGEEKLSQSEAEHEISWARIACAKIEEIR